MREIMTELDKKKVQVEFRMLTANVGENAIALRASISPAAHYTGNIVYVLHFYFLGIVRCFVSLPSIFSEQLTQSKIIL